jgi:hypothetical protein
MIQVVSASHPIESALYDAMRIEELFEPDWDHLKKRTWQSLLLMEPIFYFVCDHPKRRQKTEQGFVLDYLQWNDHAQIFVL